MPNITIEGPQIKELQTKRSLVKEITEVAARAYGFPEESIVVLIKENLPENVGVGSKLISDQRRD